MSRKITLVGTAHLSTESAARVRETVERERPAVVAVELDGERYERLRANESPSVLSRLRRRGDMSRRALALYVLFALAQKRAARRLGVTPGVDMRAGVEAAVDVGAAVALVDRDSDETMNRLAEATLSVDALRAAVRSLTSAERRTELGEAAERVTELAEELGLAGASTPAEQMRVLEEMPYGDLERFTDAVAKLFPRQYEAMVASRDRFMAGKLHLLARERGDVVAVVGRGHVPGLRRELDRLG